MSDATTDTPTEQGGMQLEELLALPVAFGLDTANRALRLGRTKGFDLAKRGEYPCRVLRVGRTYRVTRADLLRTLGIESGEGAGTNSTAVPFDGSRDHTST